MSENRPLKDGEIVPACAAACPSQAIVFGDLKDPDSRVSKLARSGRGYNVLEELGVRPAVTYLTDVRNPAGGGNDPEVTAGPSQFLREPSIFLGPITAGGLDDQVLAYPGSKPPLKWFVAFAFTSIAMLLASVSWVTRLIWASASGATTARVLGLRHHQLRILGGHRPRGHPDLGDPLSFPQALRNAIARFAEAMTIFAVMCAGLFPLIHLGGPGWPSGCCPIQTSGRCGPTSARRCSGTYSR